MKPNRKRIVAAVVFAVTLVLGTTALVLAWRLQQEKKITEEEASAAETCSGYDWKCGSYNCPAGCQSECIPRGDCEAQQTQLCRCKVVEGGGTCTGKGCSGTGSCDQYGCSVSCKDNVGCDWNCADANCGIIYVGTAVCKGGPIGNPEWPEAQGYTCKAEWCPSECKNSANTCKSNSEAGRDDCEIVYSKPLGDGLNGRTPNPDDSKYWCTVTQVDSNGSNGAFTLMAIGDNGEYCYTVNSLNNWQCTNGHTNPDQLDWNCNPEPLTVAGNVYCQDPGGQQYPIVGATVLLYKNGRDNLDGTLSNCLPTGTCENIITGSNGAFINADPTTTADSGFDVSITTLPTDNLPTGQPYSAMIPANPKAVNCTNNSTTGCQGGNPENPGNFCGTTDSSANAGTNYSWCGLGSGDHTGFDFVYTNCTPTIEAYDCTSKTTEGNVTTVNPGGTITYTVNYTSENITVGNLWVLDKLDADVESVSFDSGNPACGATMLPGCCMYYPDADSSFPTEVNSGNFIACQPRNLDGSIKYTVTLKDNATSGSIANHAYVGTNNSGTWKIDGTGCERTVTINTPDARCTGKDITKINDIVNTSDNPTIDPGDEVEFTIGYENNGDVAGKVMVSDPIPTGFESPEIVSPTTGCSITNNTLTCSIQTEAGASGNVVFKATAKSNVRDLETENVATIGLDIDDDGTSEDGTTANNVCSTEPIPSEAGIVCVGKVATPDIAAHRPGDIIDYTVRYYVENGPVTVNISEPVPQYLTILDSTDYPLPEGCEVSNDTLTCVVVEENTGDYENILVFHAQIDMDIPLDGTDITNIITVKEEGKEPGDDAECPETIHVEHEAPSCVATTPSVMTIRVADLAGTTVSLSTTGTLGTHSDLDFKWTATCGTLSSTDWHASSGTPTNGVVADVVTWTPPTDGTEGETCDLKVYVRPTGSTDATGVSDDDCESTATITALDLVCNWLVPNDEYQYFPFDMTFAADIGGDQGAAFSYDLNFGDGSTHYTGTGTVASGTTVELPYIPPQDQPHTYDSDTPASFAPSLTVTNTETGETSVCPTVLAGLTQSSWSIVKDSDVDTCAAENSTVTYTIVVTNTGDYTADLAEVRDTLDSKVDTSTLTNIRECDSNGLNCTTYNKTDVLDGRTITWPGRTFTAGESRRYLYTVTINSAGDYYNVAEAIPETGETVRDDELFPTCEGKAPQTGVMTTAALVAILGVMIVAAGTYAYKTEAGAQIVANVLGKTGRAIRKTTHRKESFERGVIKSSKDKLKD